MHKHTHHIHAVMRGFMHLETAYVAGIFMLCIFSFLQMCCVSMYAHIYTHVYMRTCIRMCSLHASGNRLCCSYVHVFSVFLNKVVFMCAYVCAHVRTCIPGMHSGIPFVECMCMPMYVSFNMSMCNMCMCMCILNVRARACLCAFSCISKTFVW
jgi:hypothetical protein